MPSAHTDMQKYFKVIPHSINQMIVTLEKKELIQIQPRVARSISLLILLELLSDIK